MKTIDIDLDDLIFAYQDDSPDNVYYLDTEFGDIRFVNQQLEDLRDLTDEIELSTDRFLYVPKEPRNRLVKDLKSFTESLENSQLKRVLAVAFDSPHILESFKKILAAYPSIYKELEDYLYRQTKSEVLNWLAANAIAPTASGIQE